MNTGLTQENYDDLSKYRQQRAHETLTEIPFLIEQGYYKLPPTACIMHVTMLLWLCLTKIVYQPIHMLE